MRYVLVIPGWFPSKVNFLAGDFIERHAKAASVYFPVKVLFVVKDHSLPNGKIELVHQQLSEHYETFIYYYSCPASVMGKLFSVWLQAKCLARGFQLIAGKYGLPSLLHAHVLVKHAWFALKQSKRHRIPLLASEQWTGYLPEAKGEFESLSVFQKRTMKKVFNHAVHVTTVSDYLSKKIKERFFFTGYTVIPNLVDTTIFQPSPSISPDKTRIIHISTLSQQKNFDDIISACQLLSHPENFELLVVGPKKQEYIQRVYRSGCEHYIFFREEVPHAELSKLISASDALLLYSNYETFGCVIVEANACGVPVITSDFPVFDENVIEGITGLKVRLDDPQALADCMRKFINKEYRFDKEEIIRITKQKYSSEVIGKQFAEVYKRYANLDNSLC
jgi:glycosyltransferase involved in cell wall biosynthesis